MTLAEFTLGGWGNQDFYDVSLVDGYNLPMLIKVVNPRKTGRPDGHYDCNNAGCIFDNRNQCPSDVQVTTKARPLNW